MLRFEVRPFIRHARNTEGGTFLSFSLDMLEIQRADQFLCYDLRSLDLLEIQRADIFLAFSLDILEMQRADHFLC